MLTEGCCCGCRDLGHNALSSFDSGTFAPLTGLETLVLSYNRLESIPSGAFDALTSMQYLQLAGNRLVTLPDGLLTGLTRLRFFALQNNRVRDLPVSVLTALGKLPPAQAGAPPPEGAAAGVFLSPNIAQFGPAPPLPNASNTSASAAQPLALVRCSFGYELNQTGACELPRFGPTNATQVQALWTLGDPFFGSATAVGHMVVGESYSTNPPGLDPKETTFVGYTGGFNEIEYRLDFGDHELNISCGDAVDGSTIGAWPNVNRVRGSTVLNPNHNQAFCSEQNTNGHGNQCGPAELFGSGEVHYTFEIRQGTIGNISFSTCEFFASFCFFFSHFSISYLVARKKSFGSRALA